MHPEVGVRKIQNSAVSSATARLGNLRPAPDGAAPYNLGGFRQRVTLLAGLALLLAACSSAPPRLKHAEVASKTMGHAMNYAVYTPPNWSPGERLPLVVFLHGAGDDHKAFDEHGMGTYLDHRSREPEAPRAIIVLPQGDFGFWENWADGSRLYRSWVMDEVVPQVQKQYGTLACPQHCHLMGVSMGGYGVFSYAAAGGALFKSITPISAPVPESARAAELYDDFWINLVVPLERIWGPLTPENSERRDIFKLWRSPADLRGMKLYLAWGSEEDEHIRGANEELLQHLQEKGIPFRHQVYNGGHKWSAWKPVIWSALQAQLGEAEPLPRN